MTVTTMMARPGSMWDQLWFQVNQLWILTTTVEIVTSLRKILQIEMKFLFWNKKRKYVVARRATRIVVSGIESTV